jgi:hypothetical protein
MYLFRVHAFFTIHNIRIEKLTIFRVPNNMILIVSNIRGDNGEQRYFLLNNGDCPLVW